MEGALGTTPGAAAGAAQAQQPGQAPQLAPPDAAAPPPQPLQSQPTIGTTVAAAAPSAPAPAPVTNQITASNAAAAPIPAGMPAPSDAVPAPSAPPAGQSQPAPLPQQPASAPAATTAPPTAPSATAGVPATRPAASEPAALDRQGSLALLAGKSLSLRHFADGPSNGEDATEAPDGQDDTEQLPGNPSGRPQIQPLTIPTPLGDAALMPNLWSLTSPVSLPLTPAFTPAFDNLLTPAQGGLPSPSAQLLAIFQQIQQQVQAQKPGDAPPGDAAPGDAAKAPGASTSGGEGSKGDQPDAGSTAAAMKNLSAFDLPGGPSDDKQLLDAEFDATDLFSPGDQGKGAQQAQQGQLPRPQQAGAPQVPQQGGSVGPGMQPAQQQQQQQQPGPGQPQQPALAPGQGGAKAPQPPQLQPRPFPQASQAMALTPFPPASAALPASKPPMMPPGPASATPPGTAPPAASSLTKVEFDAESNMHKLMIFDGQKMTAVGSFRTYEEAAYAAELLGPRMPAAAGGGAAAAPGPSTSAAASRPPTSVQDYVLQMAQHPQQHSHLMAQMAMASLNTPHGSLQAALLASAVSGSTGLHDKATAGFEGVRYIREKNRWQAFLTDPETGTIHTIGVFNSAEDAARTHDIESIKRFGVTAPTNFPKTQYGVPMLAAAQQAGGFPGSRKSSSDAVPRMQGMPGQPMMRIKAEDKKPKTKVPGARTRDGTQAKVTSQYKGVSWNSACSKWVAVLWDRELKRARHIGSYESEEEAARAYDREAIKMLGPEAGLNFRESAAEYLADVGGQFPAQEGGHLSKGSSQYRGVSWHERSQRWEVRVWGGGKQHFIGSFTSELEAARAYDKAVLRLRGQDARSRSRMNFPVTDYNLEELQAEAQREAEAGGPGSLKGNTDRGRGQRGRSMAALTAVTLANENMKRMRNVLEAGAAAGLNGAGMGDDEDEDDGGPGGGAYGASGAAKKARLGAGGVGAAAGGAGGKGGSAPGQKFKGVRLSKSRKRWIVHMFDSCRQEPRYVGSFDNCEVALRTYDQEALRLRGATARTNYDLSHYPAVAAALQAGKTPDEVTVDERSLVPSDAEDGVGCVSYDDLHGKWVVVMRTAESPSGWTVVAMYDLPDSAQNGLDAINTQHQMMAAAQAAYSGQIPVPEHPLKRGLQPTSVPGVYYNDAEQQFEAYVDYYGLPQRVGVHGTLEEAALCITRYSNPRGVLGGGGDGWDSDEGGNPYAEPLDPNEDVDDAVQLQLRSESEYRGVNWDPSSEKWRVLVWDGEEQQVVGLFENEVDAARAFDRAIIQLKGTGAATNFPLADYEDDLPEDAISALSIPRSKFKGVQFNPNGSWDGVVRVNSHVITLGAFTSEENAAQAFDAAAISLRGHNAATNFPATKYPPQALREAQAIISVRLQEMEEHAAQQRRLKGESWSGREQTATSRARRGDNAAADPSSKYLGVSLDSSNASGPPRWEVNINKNGKIIYGGHYATAEEAAQAYDEFALKLLGPDTQLNFPNVTKGDGKGDPMGRGGPGEGRDRWWPGPGKRSSQYKGVSWAEASMKWRAQCWTGSKVQYIGYYETEEEAARAYDIAILKLRGPNTQTNFDPSTYDLKAILAEAEAEQCAANLGALGGGEEGGSGAGGSGSRRTSGDDGGNSQARREAIQQYAAAIAAAAAAAAQQSEEEKREMGLVAVRMQEMGGHPPVSKNSSLYRGVRWHERNTKWEARIFDGFRQKSLGYFEQEEDAARAYDREAIRIKGSCAPTNFSHSDYQEELRGALENPPPARRSKRPGDNDGWGGKRARGGGHHHSQHDRRGSKS